MKKSLTVALVVILIAAATAAAWWATNQPSASENSTETTQTTNDDSQAEQIEVVQYQGEDGKTALELLQEHADVDMRGSGEMVFVSAINGVEADANTEFWAFLVNGEMANVGAGQYETSSSDTITWELQTIDPNFSTNEENQ